MNNALVLRGDWRKMRHKFERHTTAGEYMARVAMDDLAEYTKDTLYSVVNSEPSPRNADSTIKRKGFDAPMLETGGFGDNDSIVIDKYGQDSTATYVIKGNPFMTHERSEESYDDILAINSIGGGKVPSRDMLGIAYNLCEPELKRYARNSLNEWLKGG